LACCHAFREGYTPDINDLQLNHLKDPRDHYAEGTPSEGDHKTSSSKTSTVFKSTAKKTRSVGKSKIVSLKIPTQVATCPLLSLRTEPNGAVKFMHQIVLVLLSYFMNIFMDGHCLGIYTMYQLCLE